MIRAVFLDIDGTLVSFETHRIPASAMEALYAAKKNGVKLFIATGRHTSVIEEGGVLEGFPFDGYVSLNGQYCYTSERVIYENSIHPDDIRALLELFETHPFPCGFIEEAGLYNNLIDERVIRAHEAVKIKLPKVADPRRSLENKVYQILLYAARGEEELPLSVLPHCSATRWSDNFADVIPQGGGKDVGIGKMLEHFGISVSETLAIGDGENDISMLKYCGIGVAMGNASDMVKSAADAVTDDVDHDGLYNAFQRYGII